MAFSLAAREAIWLRLLLTKLGLLTLSNQLAEIYIHKHNKCAEAILSPDSMLHLAPIPNQIQPLPMDQIQPLSTNKDLSSIEIKGDNQNFIILAKNLVLHIQTKYIDIQHHYIQDKVSSGRISLIYTPTEEMLADRLTKPLSHVKFLNFIR